MAESVPQTIVNVSWDSALEFTCTAGKHEFGIDGSSYSAPSPVQMFAASIATCMAIDLVHILRKSRCDLRALEARFTGERAGEDPKRFVRIALSFALTTTATSDQVERAIQLSREKYCSVWNSVRPDTELDISYTIEQPDCS